MHDDHSPSSLSRRRILGLSGVGILAGAFGYLGLPAMWKAENPTPPGSAARPRSEPATPATPTDLTGREGFLPHLDSEFQLEAPSLSATCRLVEVSETEIMVAPTARYASYSLLFSAAKNFPAESRIYRVFHPHMETMELFLSPVGRSVDKIHLEAICNQRV